MATSRPGTMLQSAMEYLMTYGWAILAIAIVMVSLYSLGIFNTGSLQPTATPGSCEIVRTVAQTSLAGQCNNLIPRYVGQFNGQSSRVDIPYSRAINGVSNSVITVSAWVKTTSTATYSIIFSTQDNSGGGIIVWSYVSGHAGGWSGGGSDFSSSKLVNDNLWHNVVVVWSGLPNNNTYVYVDGIQANNVSRTFTTSSYDNQIGAECDNNCVAGRFFPGSIANVQVYNTSLDNTTVKALYREGIGGAPIDVKHMVGWWPLNGNANDYSGNNNQGTSYNVTWNANWQSGYTAPTT